MSTSNEEMYDIMDVVRSLKGYGLLIKGVRETTKNEAKEQGGEILRLLTEKGVIQTGEVVIETSQGWRTIIAGQNF